MKKSFNVNLGGRLFQIDEDAYEQLFDYLTSIKTCFKNNECGEEIATDIEIRMGELFDTALAGFKDKIVTLSLVNEIIARMGKPEAMLEESDANIAGEENSAGDKERESTLNNKDGNTFDTISAGKKLYRDGNNKMLGGVVAGLSAYCGIDVTLLRVIFVILFFVSVFWSFLLYLIAWAIIPLAVTTTDKLRMRGIEPTPENIAENIVREEPAINKIMRNIKEVGNKGVSLLLMILFFVLVAGIIIQPHRYHFGEVYSSFVFFMPFHLFMSWIAVATIIVIPVASIIIVSISKWKEVSMIVKIMMFVDWILALIKIFSFTRFF